MTFYFDFGDFVESKIGTQKMFGRVIDICSENDKPCILIQLMDEYFSKSIGAKVWDDERNWDHAVPF